MYTICITYVVPLIYKYTSAQQTDHIQAEQYKFNNKETRSVLYFHSFFASSFPLLTNRFHGEKEHIQPKSQTIIVNRKRQIGNSLYELTFETIEIFCFLSFFLQAI